MPSNRAKLTDFQNRLLHKFPERRLDPYFVEVLAEMATRIHETGVYPPVLEYAAVAIAKITQEIQQLPEVPEEFPPSYGQTAVLSEDGNQRDPDLRTSTNFEPTYPQNAGEIVSLEE